MNDVRSQRPERLNLRDRFPQRWPFLVFYTSLALLLLAVIWFNGRPSRALPANFYPQTCLGDWLNPALAENGPDYLLNINFSGFDENNSAIYSGHTARIFCGDWQGDIVSGRLLRKATLQLYWRSVPAYQILTSTSSDGYVEKQLGVPTALDLPLQSSPTTTNPLPQEPTSFPEAAGNERPSQFDENVQPVIPIAPDTTEDSGVYQLITGHRLITPALAQDKDISAATSSFVISYSFDGYDWQELGVTHPDQLPDSLSLPLNGSEQLAQLQIAIRGGDGVETDRRVFLDGMAISVEYEETFLQRILGTDEAVVDDTTFDNVFFSTIKTDYTASEDAQFILDLTEVDKTMLMPVANESSREQTGDPVVATTTEITNDDIDVELVTTSTEVLLDMRDRWWQPRIASAQTPTVEIMSAEVWYADREKIDTPVVLNRDGDKMLLRIPRPTRVFRPGRYQMRLIISVDGRPYRVEQDFTWGVLALNTNKSIYSPGDTADIAMAVLDDTGNMVCDALLQLSITSPSGGSIELSTENGMVSVNPDCFLHKFTLNPDFIAHYTIAEPGTYEMNLRATTQQGTFSVKDSFEVRPQVLFDVERLSATRIYPPEDYPMVFTVIANQDYSGPIEELVPSDLDIYLLQDDELNQLFRDRGLSETNIIPAVQLVEQGEYKKIIWQADMRAGEIYHFGYKYMTPNLSPYFYLIGPLQIGDFAETRQWQLAIDAEVVIDGTILDATDEHNPGPAAVFTSGTDGYVFYIDGTTADVVYATTTDSGVTWSAPVAIDGTTPAVTWGNVAIWYDRWTPGDTTGNKIHIAAVNQTDDDVYYNYLDVSDLSTFGWSAADLGTQWDPAGADGNVSITKATNGDIYLTGFGTFDAATKNKIYKSTSTPAVWTNTSYTATSGLDDGDYGQLLPLANGDILFIMQDITANKVISKEWINASSTWAHELTIDTWVENGTYDSQWGAVINKSSGDVYLTGINATAQVTNDIKFYKFTESSRGWETLTDVLSNSAYALQPTPIFNESTGDIYVVYVYGVINSDTSIYYKKSTDGGISWSAQSVALNTTVDDFKNVRTNFMNSNIFYAVWYNDDTNTITGSEVPQTVTVSPVPNASQIDVTILDATDEYNPSPTMVYTSSSTGYVFYVDATTADLVYSKTSDGGETWSAAVAIDGSAPAVNWANVAVWYDRWTPGNVSGTKIHIAAVNDTVGDEDIYYNYLDTNGETTRGSWLAAILTTAWAVDADAGPSITMATSGDIYISGAGTMGVSANAVYVSSNTPAVWTNTNFSAASGIAGGDFNQLIALPNNEVLYIMNDVSANKILSRKYNGAWQTERTIDASFTESATYDVQWGASLNKFTGNVYLAGSNQVANGNNDLEFYKYTFSSDGWAAVGDIISNNNQVLQANVAIDENNGEIYVTYIRGGTINASTDVYFRISDDEGQNWGEETQLNTITDDIKNVRTNFMNPDRLAAVWYNDDLNDIVTNSMGISKFDLAAYRWFANADSVDVGSPLAATNSSTTLSSTGEQFRLRMLLNTEIAVTPINDVNFRLQYAVASGTCDTAFSGESYQDVATSTGDIRFYDNGSVTDGAALTENANDPKDGTRTILPQTYEEGNNFYNSQYSIFRNRDGKWDFSLVDYSAPPDTTYCFRVVRASGPINNHTVVPEITTTAGGGGELSVDIVDAAGSPISSPLMSLPTSTLAYDCQLSTGSFGTSTEKIRILNTTGSSQWTVSMAAATNTALWDASGISQYDFNDTGGSPQGCSDSGDTDSFAGLTRSDPSVAVITPQVGCTATGLTLGSAASFDQGVVDSITILTAGMSAGTGCYWDITGIGVSQRIPAEQPVGSYTIDFVVTITAS